MHESLVSGDDCTEAMEKKRSKAKKEGKRERRRRREWRKMEADLKELGGVIGRRDGIAEEGNRGERMEEQGGGR